MQKVGFSFLNFCYNSISKKIISLADHNRIYRGFV